MSNSSDPRLQAHLDSFKRSAARIVGSTNVRGAADRAALTSPSGTVRRNQSVFQPQPVRLTEKPAKQITIKIAPPPSRKSP